MQPNLLCSAEKFLIAVPALLEKGTLVNISYLDDRFLVKEEIKYLKPINTEACCRTLSRRNWG